MALPASEAGRRHQAGQTCAQLLSVCCYEQKRKWLLVDKLQFSYKKGKGDRMGAGAVVREQDRNEKGDEERIISGRKTSISRVKALGLDSKQSLQHRSTGWLLCWGSGRGCLWPQWERRPILLNQPCQPALQLHRVASACEFLFQTFKTVFLLLPLI